MQEEDFANKNSLMEFYDMSAYTKSLNLQTNKFTKLLGNIFYDLTPKGFFLVISLGLMSSTEPMEVVKESSNGNFQLWVCPKKTFK